MIDRLVAAGIDGALACRVVGISQSGFFAWKNRQFVADRPDKLWVTDITEHPRRTGKVYCAAVVDVFSRRVVGWAIADHIRAELVVDALDMARWRRQPEPGTVVHSDRGSQYTSWAFGHRLRLAGLLGSTGRVASSVDNGLMESFWSTM